MIAEWSRKAGGRWLSHVGSVWAVSLVLAAALSLCAAAPEAAADEGGGTVYTWGRNCSGQLGDDTTNDRPVPGEVSDLTNVVAVAAGGSHAVVCTAGGAVWAWGANGCGQLGDNTTTNRHLPVQVHGPGDVGFLSDVVGVAAASDHTAAVKTDGTVWTWGDNSCGELGDGTTDSRLTPGQVPGLTGVSAVACGSSYTVALKGDGTVWAWGRNTNGQLGDGTTEERLSPVQVTGPGGEGTLTNITAIAAGSLHTLAVAEDGKLYGWGYGGGGRLGIGGDASDQLTPVQVTTLTGVSGVAASGSHSLAVKNDGTVYAWGSNQYGQCSNGTTPAQYNYPVQVWGPGGSGFLTGVDAVAAANRFSVALKGDGTVWSWGDNEYGMLGDGSFLQRLSPVQAVGLSNVHAISAGDNYYSIAASWLVPRTLTVQSTGASGVQVDVSPDDLNSQGAGLTEFTRSYDPATEVELTAPDTWNGWTFIKWTCGGADYAITPGITVTMDADTTVAAVYSDSVHALTVQSAPLSGVGVQVSPADARGQGDGQTEFTRTYEEGTVVSLTAPAVVDFRLFVKWTRDGADHDTSRSTSVTVDAACALAAVYESERHGYAVYAWGGNDDGQLGDGTTTRRYTPILVPGMSDVVAMAGGHRHTLALRADGTVWAWGGNDLGQLGDGTTNDSLVPIQVPDLADVVAIACDSANTADKGHSVAVKADGTVWTWGCNDYGQLGDGSTTHRSSPVQVPGVTGVIAVDGGADYTLALKSDGTVWAWGHNGWEGRLGDGTQDDRLAPIQVHGPDDVGFLTDVVAIAAGLHHAGAVKSDGTVWCWGSNSAGQAGSGDTTVHRTPVQVRDTDGEGYLTDVVALAAGYLYKAAVKGDGTVYAWGSNGSGQLGDGTTDDSSIPVQVHGPDDIGFLTGVMSIAAMHQCLVLKSDGTAWAWGNNDYGRLGDGTTTDRWTPVQVHGLDDVGFLADMSAVAVGRTHSLALGPGVEHTLTVQSDPVGVTVALSPADKQGQADGETEFTRTYDENVEVLLTAPETHGGEPFVKWTRDGADHADTAATTVTMDADCTMAAVYGYALTVSSSPVAGAAITVSPEDVEGHGGGLTGFTRRYHGGTEVALTAPAAHTGRQFLKWTKDGADHDTSRSTSVTVDAACAMEAVYESQRHGYAVYAWGSNTYGRLGDGTTTHRSTPVLATGMSDVVVVAGGECHTLAVKTDGTVWAWGHNETGQLGDGTTTDRHEPVQVLGPGGAGFLTNVVAVDANGSGSGGIPGHSVALLSDGTVWAWGWNSDGQLGDGTTNDRWVPGQVPDLTDVVAVSAGASHTLAVKSDGTVWAWGNNNLNQLGDGTGTDRLSPVQVHGPNDEGFLTDVVAVAAGYSHSFAVKGDGTLWAWGYDSYGQLGNGAESRSGTPIQVHGPGDQGFLTGVESVAAGCYCSAAVTTDRAVYAWGRNGSGQIGDGTTTDRDAPVQVHGPGDVGFLTDISSVVASRSHKVALKADGTVWAWGDNDAGRLGDGTWTDRWTPVQVHGRGDIGFLTGAVSVARGTKHSLALAPPPEAYGCHLAVSSWPDLRAAVTVSPPDKDGRADGVTAFGRRYDADTQVTLTASATLNGRPFLKWTKNGANYDTSAATTVTMDEAGARLVAVYETPECRLYAWGHNSHGEVGDGTTNARTTPILVSGLASAASLGTGERYSLALLTDGTVRSWGSNDTGQLGDGSTDERHTPVTVNGLADVIAVEGNSAGTGAETLGHTVALRSDGTAWTWGDNTYGQLGDGTTTNRTTPAQVPDLTNVVAVSAGFEHTVALKADGTVWAWGRNDNGGRLGDGTTTHRYSPVQVVGPNGLDHLTGVVAVSGGYWHSAALRADGSIWTWGGDNCGALGDGADGGSTCPVQVHGPGDVGFLADIVGVSAGIYRCAALKADGTLWTWGCNSSGQLGDGTTEDRQTPVQVHGPGDVGFLEDVVGADIVNHTVARKAEGTAWAWGVNYGRLGDGSWGPSSLPVQVTGLGGVGVLENVVVLGAGGGHTLALAPPPPEHTLTVQSDPASGATITVSPADNQARSDGQTEFTRTYYETTVVTLTAPATLGDDVFAKWTKDGADYTTDLAASVAVSGDCALVAVYRTPTCTLTVQSDPTAATITVTPADTQEQGDGETEFTRIYGDGVEVSLTAPATHGGEPFLKWTRNGADHADTAATSVTMDEDCTMAALYGYELTVGSSPVAGVAVTVSPDDIEGHGSGATQFSRCYHGATVVSLTAPATLDTRPFVKWTRGGADHDTSAATTVSIDADTAMEAVYGARQVTLTVQSSPESGATVQVSPNDNDGLGDGDTEFTRTYDEGAEVTLTAPATQGVKVFQKWTRGGADYDTTAVTTVTVDADTTMAAVYVTPVYTLTVQSQPDAGAQVTVSPEDKGGLGDGVTEFTRSYDAGTVVSLTAPASHGGMDFLKWTKDGAYHDTDRSTTVEMTAGCTLAAVYGQNQVAAEADAEGPIGATVEIPIGLSLRDGESLTSFQFQLKVTPSTGSPPAITTATFVPDAGLPPPGVNDNTAVPGSVLVGWMLDISPALTGIRTLGVLQVPIPEGTGTGDEYTVSVVNPSGTNQGTSVTLHAGPDRTVTVSGTWYLVGDVEGYGGGDSAGQFGNGVLDNADVRAAFYWSFGIAAPPGSVPVPVADTDRFDAADASTEDEPPEAGGNGAIDNADVRLTFLRSLLPSLDRYERCQTAGGRISRLVGEEPLRDACSEGANTVGPEADQTVQADTTVDVPILLTLQAGTQLTSFQFRVGVEPSTGGPPAISTVTFIPDAGLPAPPMNDNVSVPGSALLGWPSDISPPLSGTRTLGVLRVPVPAGAGVGDQYVVAVYNPSGTDVGAPVPLQPGPTRTLTLGQFWELAFLPSPGGAITGDPEGTYPDGAEVDLHAEAEGGYRFVRWQVNGADAGEEADLQLVMDEDKDVKAVCACQLTLTVVGGTGSGTYDEGSEVPIAADIPDGYAFVEWTGDVDTVADIHDAETTIAVNGNWTVTAVIELAQVLEIAAEVTAGEEWVYQNTETTTDDRHISTATITLVSEASPGEVYDISIADDGPDGANFTLGAVTDNRLVDDTMTVEIVGGRVGPSTIGVGGAAYNVTITVEGQDSGQSDSAQVQVSLLRIGDINRDGSLTGTDRQLFNQRLNNVATPYTDRTFDLDGSGGAPTGTDKQVMNQALNNVPLP